MREREERERRERGEGFGVELRVSGLGFRV